MSKTADDARRAPTLEQVAARAGVGRGTASRVVNGSANVSDATRENVLAAVRELGYVPNRAARSLVTKRTDSIALVVAESEERFFAQPFFASIVRGISVAASAAHRQLLLTMSQSAAEHTRLEEYLTGSHVDGVLLLSLHGDDPLPRYLEERGVPTVVGGRPLSGTPVSWVDVDNFGASSAAVAHLVDRGRHRIATIAGPQDMVAGRGRLYGYRDALNQSGIPVDESLVAYGDFSEESGLGAMRQLLRRRPDLDAVFVASDPMAFGALRGLREAGRRVPGDVSVVGFDDLAGARHADPPLTTVHQPIERMGQEMVRLLVARLDGTDASANEPSGLHMLLEAHLVVRSSS
ncbi:MAG: LacI family DNA-binding transcriptional regulator [Candidatus Nanopelagicales bacterium]